MPHLAIGYPKAFASMTAIRTFLRFFRFALVIAVFSSTPWAAAETPSAEGTICRPQALEDALSRYRCLEAQGGWPRVPAGPTLREGDRNQRISFLKRRLTASGDLTAPAGRADVFDGILDAAVKKFQARHGLQADGLVGVKTLRELNAPIIKRIQQLAASVRRCGRLPVLPDRRHILVNVADFTLKLFEDGKLRLSMPVIVGTAYRQTPVVCGRISSLTINPYWNVPLVIAIEDLLPKIRENPEYLRRFHFRVLRDWETGEEVDAAEIDWANLSPESFPYWLRQDPDPDNPLGRVKFSFPNPYGLFLHDTPAGGLFRNDVRTFSSGCIRLARPLGLAVYLLQGTPLGSMEALTAAISSSETQKLDIPSPIAVQIVYLTAWVDADGTIQFRPDIYNWDPAL